MNNKKYKLLDAVWYELKYKNSEKIQNDISKAMINDETASASLKGGFSRRQKKCPLRGYLIQRGLKSVVNSNIYIYIYIYVQVSRKQKIVIKFLHSSFLRKFFEYNMIN